MCAVDNTGIANILKNRLEEVNTGKILDGATDKMKQLFDNSQGDKGTMFHHGNPKL